MYSVDNQLKIEKLIEYYKVGTVLAVYNVVILITNKKYSR